MRAAAAEALAALGERSVVPELLEMLGSWNAASRSGAALALGMLSVAEAVPALREKLTDSEPSVRAAAARSLGHLGDSGATGPLAEALNDADPLVRLSAAKGLGLLGDPAAADALAAVVGDIEVDVGEAAAEALVALGPAGMPALATALAQALQLRRDTGGPWGAFGSERWTKAFRLAVGALLKLTEEQGAPEPSWAALGEALRGWKGALGILSGVPAEVK